MGIVVSMGFCWQICLAMIPFFPLLIMGFIARAKATMSAKRLGQDGNEVEGADDMAIGIVENMKNISTLALVRIGVVVVILLPYSLNGTTLFLYGR